MSDTITLRLQVPAALYKRLKDAAERKSAAVTAVALERLEASFRGRPGRSPKRQFTAIYDSLLDFLVLTEVARRGEHCSRAQAVKLLKDQIYKDEKKTTLLRRYNALKNKLKKDGTFEELEREIRAGRDLVVTAGARTIARGAWRTIALREAVVLCAKGKALDLARRELRPAERKKHASRATAVLKLAAETLTTPPLEFSAQTVENAPTHPLPILSEVMAYITEVERLGLSLDPDLVMNLEVCLGKK